MVLLYYKVINVTSVILTGRNNFATVWYASISAAGDYIEFMVIKMMVQSKILNVGW